MRNQGLHDDLARHREWLENELKRFPLAKDDDQAEEVHDSWTYTLPEEYQA